MQKEKLETRKKYWLQQGTQKVLTMVEGVDLKMDFEKGENIDAKTL